MIRKLQRRQLLLPPEGCGVRGGGQGGEVVPSVPHEAWAAEGTCPPRPLPRISVRARPRPLGSARSRADSPPPRLGLPPAPPSPAAAAHSAAAQEAAGSRPERREETARRGAASPPAAHRPRLRAGSRAAARRRRTFSVCWGATRGETPHTIPPRRPEPPGRGCFQAEAERRGGAASPPPDPKLFSAAPHGAQAGRRGRGRTALRFLSPSLTRRAARGEGLGCRPRSEFSGVPALSVSGEVGQGGKLLAAPHTPPGALHIASASLRAALPLRRGTGEQRGLETPPLGL